MEQREGGAVGCESTRSGPMPLMRRCIPRRRLLALAAATPLLAACAEPVAPRRLSQLWPEPPLDRAAALTTAGWQGYWYARYVGGLIATQPGVGLPANTLDTNGRAVLEAARPGATPIALPYATATVDDPTTSGGDVRVQQTDGVVRVRTAALYMRLLQALAQAHRVRTPEAPPGAARTHERRWRRPMPRSASKPPTASRPTCSAPIWASSSIRMTPTTRSATSTSSGPRPTPPAWRWIPAREKSPPGCKPQPTSCTPSTEPACPAQLMRPIAWSARRPASSR